MCLDRHKNHGCGQKKPKSTSSAIFGVETAAKCCELKRCAEQVRNRTDKANLNFSPELYRLDFFRINWTFLLPPKRQLSILFFFDWTNLFLSFVVFACFAITRVTIRFRAKNRRYSIGLHQLYATSYWWLCGADGRTDGRSREYYVTSKMSWLDRLANLLSNGAPLAPLSS